MLQGMLPGLSQRRSNSISPGQRARGSWALDEISTRGASDELAAPVGGVVVLCVDFGRVGRHFAHGGSRSNASGFGRSSMLSRHGESGAVATRRPYSYWQRTNDGLK